jgi:hypothetical protein
MKIILISIYFLLCGLNAYSQGVNENRMLEAEKYYANRDYVKSYLIYSELAEQGVSSAHYNRAILLSKGLGVDKNYALAFKSFYSSAMMGNTSAKTQIGIWMVEGVGISKDINRGLKWLTEAEAEGSLDSSFHLARIYAKGDSIERKPESALKILESLLRNPSAKRDWKATVAKSLTLYSQLKNIPIDQAYAHFNIKPVDLQEVNDLKNNISEAQVNALRGQLDKLASEKEALEKNQVKDREILAKESEEKINKILALSKLDQAKNLNVFNYADVHVLVIGNGAYQGAAKLINPINDANQIANKFRDYNFKVTVKYDQDRSGLVRAFNEFSRSAKDADIVIFFYAGHGIQIFGNNFILPIDVDSNDFGQASLQAIPLSTVLEQYLPGKTRLIFLDACRENPLLRTSSRGVSKGLAPMAVAEGTLISYATKDGGIALDGVNEKNSPFTTALLKHIDEPDDIAVVLRKVRQSVITTTNSKQIPWEYGSLTGDSLVLSRLKPINQKVK